MSLWFPPLYAELKYLFYPINDCCQEKMLTCFFPDGTFHARLVTLQQFKNNYLFPFVKVGLIQNFFQVMPP
jgi:hypothetical protein